MSLSRDIEFYDLMHQGSVCAQDALATRERQELCRGLLRDAAGPLLVVGCGGHDEMSVVPPGMWAVGMDVSFGAIQQSRAKFLKYRYVVGDAARLPFRSARFKTILCSEVIEHVRNSGQAPADFHRVIEAGGHLVLTTPNWLSFYGLARAAGRVLLRRDFTSRDQSYDRWSTRNRLKGQLERAGFCPVRWLRLRFSRRLGKDNIARRIG